MSTTRDPIFGCELATGRRDRDGYAFQGKTRAHIAAWVREHGHQIATDMELDHLCRRRHCIAIHHLELVTRRENELRKSWRYRARRTHCPRGHELATNGIVTPEGGRVCRACNRAAHRPTFDELLEASSIGQGLKNIRENGIEAELADLDNDLNKKWKRR